MGWGYGTVPVETNLLNLTLTEAAAERLVAAAARRGVLIGAVLIAVVSNGMNILNVSSYWQPLVIGVIILAGVSFDTYRRTTSGRGIRGRSLFGLTIGGSQPVEAAASTSGPPDDSAPKP